jgi:hypothetical protein
MTKDRDTYQPKDGDKLTSSTQGLNWSSINISKPYTSKQ